MKILAIQFRYFGDTVLIVPALRALREHLPDCELHLLVPEEARPLFEHLPWLTRLWSMPRTRGRARVSDSWPIIRALRRERFNRSVDFGGNDRGAILSLLCAARERVGPLVPGGFWGRRFCYTQTMPRAAGDMHEVLRNVRLLAAWKIPPPSSLELEIHADPTLEKSARAVLPERAILCHIASSQAKKEWPLDHWVALYEMAHAAGLQFVFSTGRGAREMSLLDALRGRLPKAQILPPDQPLATFLAWLKGAAVFISGDTGPLHFAAGLGVATIGLFGATCARNWAPIGPKHQSIQGLECHCPGNAFQCEGASHCLAAIEPVEVLKRLQMAVERNGLRS
jgi:ADP-heptose:LPS heptosyltransferase